MWFIRHCIYRSRETICLTDCPSVRPSVRSSVSLPKSATRSGSRRADMGSEGFLKGAKPHIWNPLKRGNLPAES